MYIDNQLFYDEMCKSREINQFTDSGYDMMYKIVTLIRNRYVPHSYIDKSALAYAIVETEKQLRNFNPNHEAKPNSAFNYFTEVAKRAIVKFYINIKK